MRLHALYHESLCPRQVVYLPFYLARAQACGKHEHVVVALEALLHHGGKLPALAASLVDRYAKRRQSGQVHQQVVHQIAEAAVVVATDDGSESHAVLAAQGVVADEGVQPSVVGGGEVLLPFHYECHIKIFDALFQPLHSNLVSAVPKKSINLVLMNRTLEPAAHKAWYLLGLCAHFVFEYTVYVYGLFRYYCRRCHTSWCRGVI